MIPSGLVYIRRNARVLRPRRSDADSLLANCIERDRCETPRNGACEDETLYGTLSTRPVVNAPSMSDAR
jgi:hypothetical protein